MDTNRRSDLESPSTRRHHLGDGRRAFTLTELLVVLVTLGILAVLLLPALASTQPASTKAFQCLNNMRQLAQAWTLYAEDNHDRLVINSDPHVGSGGLNTAHSWIAGVLDWTASQQNTNTAYLVNDTFSLLGSYLGRNYNVFACPATASFVSPVQRALGWSARCRSVAMDAAVGDGSKYAGFPWSATFWWAKKMSDLRSPGPSDSWVFTDEHPDSIDDGIFYMNPYAATNGVLETFTELPGSQHVGACGMAFADGNAIIHKWMGKNVPRPVAYTAIYNVAVINDPDMAWLALHTPRQN